MFSSLNGWVSGSVRVRFVKGSGGGSSGAEVESSLSKSFRFTRVGWEFVVEPPTSLSATRPPPAYPPSKPYCDEPSPRGVRKNRANRLGVTDGFRLSFLRGGERNEFRMGESGGGGGLVDNLVEGVPVMVESTERKTRPRVAGEEGWLSTSRGSTIPWGRETGYLEKWWK